MGLHGSSSLALAARVYRELIAEDELPRDPPPQPQLELLLQSVEMRHPRRVEVLRAFLAEGSLLAVEDLAEQIPSATCYRATIDAKAERTRRPKAPRTTEGGLDRRDVEAARRATCWPFHFRPPASWASLSRALEELQGLAGETGGRMAVTIGGHTLVVTAGSDRRRLRAWAQSARLGSWGSLA